MDYIAHRDGERTQSVKEHLEGTARLARQFAEAFGQGGWGYCCGMLHDIGKFSEEFLEKILESSRKQVDHSTAGAKVCFEQKGLYSYLSYCIAGHHAGLPDTGTAGYACADSTLLGRMRKKIPDYQAYQKEIAVPAAPSEMLNFQESCDPYFAISVFVRMLYSCLVDADFLDTEGFMLNGKTERFSGEDMGTLLRKLEIHIAKWLQNRETDTVNGRRTEILRHCLESGKLGRGMFRLTVPTGGGKTIASLAFALRHAVENGMERVIYVIPYTSIIEQNAKVFREILGEQNVLENHYNVDYESSEELRPMQLAAENWDKPVVVTTNVQFFESLFSNKSTRCRKLHNIANSVVIFDEAQMLPADYLKPCTAMIEELILHYQVSVVLCTATQPALEPFFHSRNGRKPTELCPRMEEQFRFFERVKFQNIGTVTEEALCAELRGERQALCIVNTRKRAQSLYRRLAEEGVYHLSTTMYPLHRRRVLAEIRQRLDEKKKCIVISTSLVEAGVDLDFQSVYRQIAGIDSMIQAAGRCNREGKARPENSIVRIFQIEGEKTNPDQNLQAETAKVLLAEGKELSSLECVEEYFGRLYLYLGERLDKKGIMEEFCKTYFQFAKVGREFRLIEENTKLIFINREAEADALLGQLRGQGCTRTGMRKAGQYCIQVRPQDFQKLYDAGMVREISEDMKDFFVLVSDGQYTRELGLDLTVETGEALFL